MTSRSVSVIVFLVDCGTCRFMFRCPIVVLINLYRCLLINPYAMPGHVLTNTCLISLMRLVTDELKIAAWKYFANSGLIVWDRILFTVVFDCCVISGTSQFPVCLFIVTLNIFCPIFCNIIFCWPSVMVHPSSHRTPYDISGEVLIVGKIWIRLAYIVRPGGWNVATCDESMVLPYGNLAVMLFDIVTGVIVGVALFSRWIFKNEFAIR